MKKLICLCLAMAALFALAAGCNREITIGQTEPTTVAVNEQDLNNAAGQFGEDLDEAAREALRKALEGGINVADIQAPTQPPETMPPTMPPGSQTDDDAARPLMRKALDTLASGAFTIKTRGTSPFGEGTNAALPVTIAMSNGAFAFELEIDWASQFRADGQSPAMAAINAGIAQSTFGKRLRIITSNEGVVFAFVDKKLYVSMKDLADEGGEPMNFDMTGAMGEIFGTKSQEEIDKALGQMTSSKVTADGKEYLCATVSPRNENGDVAGTMRYYFLDGELKRIETGEGAEAVMWEIESISDKADPAFFSTADMKVMPIDQMANMSSLSGLVG